MRSIENRLKELGIELPTPPPVANYLGTKRSGDLLFVSGRKSELIGLVGGDISENDAYRAARQTVITMLSIIKADIGDLDLIISIVKLQGFIRSAPHFTRQPYVFDGATEVLIEIFGENGRHARTATGVNQLPFGAALQFDVIIRLKRL
ncbi:MAG: RidA family protein [Bacteroidetes bacterium]|nr:RidA family protein [Bacteroidota bacterium]MDA1120511.1 RidA family protein [Bacteroidota bacterium]